MKINNTFKIGPVLRIGGFTLIEILVVATIIGLLAAGSFLSYRAVTQSGRDAKRKAELEMIRSAIEQFRSNNIYGSYPDSTELSINCSSSGGISDASNTYLSKIPLDPRCVTTSYYYAPKTAVGGDCDSSDSANPCLDFTLGSVLENGTSTCTSNNECGTDCNYCLGPYGEK